MWSKTCFIIYWNDECWSLFQLLSFPFWLYVKVITFLQFRPFYKSLVGTFFDNLYFTWRTSDAFVDIERQRRLAWLVLSCVCSPLSSWIKLKQKLNYFSREIKWTNLEHVILWKCYILTQLISTVGAQSLYVGSIIRTFLTYFLPMLYTNNAF